MKRDLKKARVRKTVADDRGWYIVDGTLPYYYLNSYGQWTHGVDHKHGFWRTEEQARSFLRKLISEGKAPERAIVKKFALRVRSVDRAARDLHSQLEVMLRLDENGKDELLDIMYNNTYELDSDFERALSNFIERHYE